jgi:hypothetical protein
MILLHNQNKIKRSGIFFFYFNCFLFFLLALGVAKIYISTINSKEIKLIDVDFKTTTNASQASLFGSINSETYYSVDCKKGNIVSDKNKIWFLSSGEARRAGYKPSKYCDFGNLIDF